MLQLKTDGRWEPEGFSEFLRAVESFITRLPSITRIAERKLIGVKRYDREPPKEDNGETS